MNYGPENPTAFSDDIDRNKPVSSNVPTIWDSVGIPSRGQTLYESIRQGFSVSVFDNIASFTGLSDSDIATAMGMSRSMLLRRRRAGQFTQWESDRLYCLTKVYSAVIGLFEGDIPHAQSWLRKPTKGLNMKAPFEMIKTSAETDAVLDLIGRLEYGAVA